MLKEVTITSKLPLISHEVIDINAAIVSNQVEEEKKELMVSSHSRSKQSSLYESESYGSELSDDLLPRCPQYTPNIPKLSEMVRLEKHKIYEWIALIRHSYYYKILPKDIAVQLEENDARRYLA